MTYNRRTWIINALATCAGTWYFVACKTSKNNTSIEANIEDNVTDDLQNPFRIQSIEGAKGHGITNRNGRFQNIFMQIVSAGDLSITDTAWESYQLDNHYKRWKFDDIDWLDIPLINYKFSEAYRHKPISIEVCFFKNGTWIYPSKIYQQLIFLN